MVKSPKSEASTPKRARDRGLGRGLSALMNDVSDAVLDNPASEESPKISKVSPDKTHENVKTTPSTRSAAEFISISLIERNPNQPRQYFDPVKMVELERSVKEKGVLQPLLVRPFESKGKTRYQIVAGERRYQAALKAGLDQLPAMIRELSDREVLEIGVVENVQRANLNPIEEASAYRNLMDEFGRTQEDVATAVGKSRSHVANMVRLLTLPDRAQHFLAMGKLSAGHARAVISAPDPLALAEMIVAKDLSVRETEKMVRRLKKGQPLQPRLETKSADIRALEKQLGDTLGLRVDLKHKGPNGRLEIHYRNDEELEDLIKRLPEGWG
ncbi:ParB/RepB/Spo0J family partition protein [Robiginitomaculum antarcticum]|uniref:ParB/RepB/Spo0J family partition protein n=1 Tax=Robiginitomaculum antarcticum TaxID=437507 RepID=UPI00036CAFB5|nr:ParB/RepB/Spo0J family partition protein [Robiginitomaculum antarcticum]